MVEAADPGDARARTARSASVAERRGEILGQRPLDLADEAQASGAAVVVLPAQPGGRPPSCRAGRSRTASGGRMATNRRCIGCFLSPAVAVSLEALRGNHRYMQALRGVSLRPPGRGVEMQNQFDPRTTSRIDPAISVGVPRAARDAGLRSYMLKVYNYMASGVLLTGIVALAVRQQRHGRAGDGDAAQVADHPRAARLRVRDELRRQPDADRNAADPVLGLRGGDGPVDVDDLPGLYRDVDRADLLRGHRRRSSGSASTATPPRRICRASARS